MPTIIALDVSLSMLRTIPGRTENPITYLQLAIKGISQLLEYLSATKLEYVSLLTYSSLCELKVDFTRDYDQIKQAAKKVEVADKICLVTLMKTVGGIFTSNWGTQSSPCHVIVFTDCGLGFGPTALTTFLQNYMGKEHEAEYSWVKILKPVKWNFICLGVHGDSYFTRALGVYQQLLDLTGIKG